MKTTQPRRTSRRVFAACAVLIVLIGAASACNPAGIDDETNVTAQALRNLGYTNLSVKSVVCQTGKESEGSVASTYTLACNAGAGNILTVATYPIGVGESTIDVYVPANIYPGNRGKHTGIWHFVGHSYESSNWVQFTVDNGTWQS